LHHHFSGWLINGGFVGAGVVACLIAMINFSFGAFYCRSFYWEADVYDNRNRLGFDGKFGYWGYVDPLNDTCEGMRSLSCG
jgi:hypothetical protein